MAEKRITEVNYDNIDLEIIRAASPDILKVIKEGVDFYFKLNLKEETDKAVIFSNGAYNPKKSKPPVFMRSSWVDDYNASCICVDDRTIHGKEVRVGWGIGTPERHYLIDMSDILKRILSIIGVKDSKVVYFGSSAGGFLSLMFATLHKNSHAIVNNPRIYAHRSNSRNNVYKGLFPGLTGAEIHKKYGGRFSVTNMMKRQNYVPKVLYILNRDSETDYNDQYLPFLKMAEKYDIDLTNISFWMYSNKESGHDYIPRNKTAAIIDLYQKGLLF